MRQPHCSSTLWSFILSPFFLLPSRDSCLCDTFWFSAASLGGWPGDEARGLFWCLPWRTMAPCFNYSSASHFVHHWHFISLHTTFLPPILTPNDSHGGLGLDLLAGRKHNDALLGGSAQALPLHARLLLLLPWSLLPASMINVRALQPFSYRRNKVLMINLYKLQEQYSKK